MTDQQRALTICCGDAQAAEFLMLWAEYCHAIDDLVDGANTASEHIIRTSGLLPLMLCTHPFFLRSPAISIELRRVWLLVANTYADSVLWEKTGEEEWQRAHADVLRHCGNDMVFAVAQICGGYDHARTISREQRAICYHTQHTEVT
jgi:hypothetical protein